MPKIKLITENLADELLPAIEKASGIYIMTSFAMESGVKLLEPHLRSASERKAEVKILAGDYLFITEPKALRRLISIGEEIEVRFWRSMGTSFHPKAYLLDYENGQGLMIVGSSNMSLSAFKLGYEWNLAVDAGLEPFTFQHALEQFFRSFYHEQTVPLNEQFILQYEEEYAINRKKYPELVKAISEMEQAEMLPRNDASVDAPESINVAKVSPRDAQLFALEALEATLDEGYDRAMVIMATGLGKTYLAGFFAQTFRRVLFIAHREEILFQAKRSFERIMPDRTGGLYNGQEKEAGSDIIFASIFTLAMKKHRERFDKKDFDLIIVDEFHHAAAKSYRAVIEYFKPKFLLGLTATPDRMDGKDIYALCDGNVAYQIHFIEAISKGWLSPFHYYGVYDDTDYTQIKWLGNKYDEDELAAVQTRTEMAERIYSAWFKYKQSRTLCFCSSIRQADFLAAYFNENQVKALSLHSKTVEMSRQEAIRRLETGELEMILTVDLFNEGVDIPSVDTLLFVRPTESLTVFTQQVGRGLRLAEGKQYCTIIDLIGNYRNADLKLQLLGTTEAEEKGKKKGEKYAAITPPPNCLIELELGVIDLLKELAAKKQPRKEKLYSAYLTLKQELGRRPSYLELHLHGSAPSREYRQEFGSYVGFLYWADELSDHHAELFLTHEAWLREVEGTVMTKSYKMVLLLAMLQRGPEHWDKPITPQEAASFFHHYLTSKEYRKKIDFSDGETTKLHVYDEKKVASLIAKMPMTKWSQSSKGQITFQDGVFTIRSLEGLVRKTLEVLYAWTRDICEYRLHVYFEKKA
jgi:DNA or RNA helicases of superfamily II